MLVEKIVDKIFIPAKLFFIVLESSETQFDLVASKIGAKLNNLSRTGPNNLEQVH